MTREEAIDIIKCLAWHTRPDEEDVEQAIKALEQQPCEDWNAVLDELKRIGRNAFKDDTDYDNLFNFISGLPNVKQEPKIGHWIEGQTDNSNIHNILCSCCCEGYPSKGHANSQYTREKFKYCPNCGARMIALQESEDKE